MIYTRDELHEDTKAVLRAITNSGETAIITHYGRFVAAVTPLDDTAAVKAALTTSPLSDEVARRIAEEAAEGEAIEDALRGDEEAPE